MHAMPRKQLPEQQSVSMRQGRPMPCRLQPRGGLFASRQTPVKRRVAVELLQRGVRMG